MAGADLRLSLLIRMSFRNRYVHRLTTVQGLHLHSGASACAFIRIDAAHCLRCRHGSIKGELDFTRTSNEQLDKDDPAHAGTDHASLSPPTRLSAHKADHTLACIFPVVRLATNCSLLRVIRGLAANSYRFSTYARSGIVIRVSPTRIRTWTLLGISSE